MIPGTHTAHLSQWSLTGGFTLPSGMIDHQQVLIAQEVCYAQHIHLPFNPLSNPRADTNYDLHFTDNEENHRD